MTRTASTSSSPTIQIQFYRPPVPPTQSAPKLSSVGKRLLRRIPKTEEEWQTARERLGINDEQGILALLSSIQTCGCDPSEYSISSLGERATKSMQKLSGSSSLVTLISFLFIIACHFDKINHVDELEVFLALEAFLKAQQGAEYRENSRFPLRVMRGARKVVTLIDRLHEKLEHRAFELLIHLSVSFTDLSRLTEYDVNHIESTIEAWNSANEIQANTPFSIALLLQLWRPNKSLDQIGESLGIRLFSHTEPNKLSEALKLSPTLVTDPMLYSDAGQDGEATGLAMSELVQHSYADVETLPSQNVGLELEEEWSYAFVARDISTNGQPEHSRF